MVLEDYSALIIQNNRFSFLSPEGEILAPSLKELTVTLKNTSRVLVIHTPFTQRKLKQVSIRTDQWLDLLELAAFIFPTRSFGFTTENLINALDLPMPERIEADFLFTLMDRLIERLKKKITPKNQEVITAQLAALFDCQWIWAPVLLNALSITLPLPPQHLQPAESVKIWKRLPKWEDTSPRPAPSHHPVERKETFDRLAKMLGPNAENRMGQMDLADIARSAFEPYQEKGQPNVVLAEAGTGTGKTLAYIAPASLWAEHNQGTVWINTYTRYLQRQIEHEFERLYPDPEERKKHVVIRKGRENYLCLLNLEEHMNVMFNSNRSNRDRIALILLCRWAEKSKDGDLLGGDLPHWYHDLFNEKLLYQLTERRGECVYTACRHYHNCFIEQSIHKAQTADIVIANHALLMKHFTWFVENTSIEQKENLPSHLIFDEAHHLPDAADSAFSIAFSAIETSELRRWLLGNEGGKTRSRGLKKRVHDLFDLMPENQQFMEKLEQALRYAHVLPSLNWPSHLSNSEEFSAKNNITIMERFFFLIRKQIQARNPRSNSNKHFIQNECDLFPVSPELQQLIPDLIKALQDLLASILDLTTKINHILTEEKEKPTKILRDRLETTQATLTKRAINPLTLWIDLLKLLNDPERYHESSKTHVSFLMTEEKNGSVNNIGLFHHWLDPTIPFMQLFSRNTQGMLLTSATLKDKGNKDTEKSWQAAEQRIGTTHLLTPPIRAALSCPFDYTRQARVYIVNDVDPSSILTVANAYFQLFMASQGGALGLFTAIHRLRAVYQNIIDPLEKNNISLFAQHIDPLSNNSLIDLFRNDRHSCLLGTDAMRDGINIPGDALRLVVFEKIPWARPDILHRERRKYFYKNSPATYDEQIVRLRLRQAFGRLIRNQTDKGIFIILDQRTPTRILSAFPKATPIQRLSLKDTIQEVITFFKESS